jgi:hypothetical protein
VIREDLFLEIISLISWHFILPMYRSVFSWLIVEILLQEAIALSSCDYLLTFRYPNTPSIASLPFLYCNLCLFNSADNQWSLLEIYFPLLQPQNWNCNLTSLTVLLLEFTSLYGLFSHVYKHSFQTFFHDFNVCSVIESPCNIHGL